MLGRILRSGVVAAGGMLLMAVFWASFGSRGMAGVYTVIGERLVSEDALRLPGAKPVTAVPAIINGQKGFIYAQHADMPSGAVLDYIDASYSSGSSQVSLSRSARGPFALVDLGDVYEAHIVVPDQDGKGSTVISTRIDKNLLARQGNGDEPGFDMAGLPRPGASRRVFSMVTSSFQVAIYESNRSAESVAAGYRSQFQANGAFSLSPRDYHDAFPGGVDIIFYEDSSSGGMVFAYRDKRVMKTGVVCIRFPKTGSAGNSFQRMED